MTVALALLLGSVLVGWLAPRHLVRLTDPVVALVAWLASVAAVIGTSAATASTVSSASTPASPTCGSASRRR
jgi:hypothetical protein